MQNQLFSERRAQYRLPEPERSQRVVLLSDDLNFCALVRSYLQDSDISVFACTTTVRAEKTFLNRFELDLWVIDVQSLGPKALGFAIQVSELNPEVSVLIVEGYKPNERVSPGLMRDEWRAIRKTIDMTEVSMQIQRLLRRRVAAVEELAMK